MTDEDRKKDEPQPHGETLPPGSPTAGEAALKKGDVEVDGPKGGKGGDERSGPTKPQG
jgi:hypothetical protein